MDISTVMPMLYAELNSAGAGDLIFWDEDELYRYADRKLQEISRKLMLFVDVQTATPGVGDLAIDLAHTGDAPPVDTRFCSLIHAAYSGATLTPATLAEIEALEANWQATAAGVTQYWIGDYLGAGMVGLYPVPAAATPVTVIAQRSAPEVTVDTPTVDAPDALADLLHMRALAEARRKRSDAWMPEAAQLADQIGDVLEKAFTAYYGEAL